MRSATSLRFAFMATLSIFPGMQVFAGDPPPQAASLDLERQVLSQGPMLLGNLRQAREAGLRRDPWGMSYSLQEARRVLDAMAVAERSIQSKSAPSADRPPDLEVPLGEPLELDRPEPGRREQAVERFEGVSGSIPLKPVSQAIDRALAALNAHPRALGAALLATEDALRQVRWKQGLEPGDWAAAQDEVLAGYALALDSRPDAPKQLAEAHQALAALSGGEPFARRLAGLQAAPVQDLAALSALVRDLDTKVRSLREAAEIGQ